MSLSNKQRAFIDQYFLCNMNATEAARRAGYSEKSIRSIASENLTKPDVQAEIKRRFEEMSVPANEVLARLGEQARVNIGEFFIIEPVQPEDKPKQDDSGQEPEEPEKDDQQPQQQFSVRLDYHKIKEKGHLVKSLTWTQNGPKLELHDAQTALLNIGKNHGLFSDKHIVTLKVEQELEQFLDVLERKLDPETYERVLAIISGTEAGQEEAGAETETEG